MSVAVHVTRINDVWANVLAGLDAGQTALLTDENKEHVHRIGTDYFFLTPSKYWDGSWNYVDVAYNEITAYGDLLVAEYIKHEGDTDTSIRFETDKITWSVGGVEFMEFLETTQSVIEINQGEADIDFIINADNLSDAFFLEGATGNVGLQTATPFADVGTAAGDFSGTGLHVKGGGWTRIILEGDAVASVWCDSAGAANDKFIALQIDSGVAKFFSFNDDATTTRVDNILVMDMGTGFVGLGTASAESILALWSTGPTLTLHNTTEEDGDAGRESMIDFRGEQSGAEITTLARIRAQHDGAADDQKGDLIFYTNDGSDADTPTERMRIDSAGVFTFSSTEDFMVLVAGSHRFTYEGANKASAKVNTETYVIVADISVNPCGMVMVHERSTQDGPILHDGFAIVQWVYGPGDSDIDVIQTSGTGYTAFSISGTTIIGTVTIPNNGAVTAWWWSFLPEWNSAI